MSISLFEEITLRLKHCLRVSADKEVAAAIGIKQTAFAACKARGSFPEKELRALAQQRPELGIDMGYVLHGRPAIQRMQAATAPTPAELEQAKAQAMSWYSTHIQYCARSAEWKSGALAGCLKAHGLPWQTSTWPRGTAQDDARNAGFEAAYDWARHDRNNALSIKFEEIAMGALFGICESFVQGARHE